MSQISQSTPAGRGLPFAPGMIWAFVAAMIALSMAPLREPILRAAATAHLHAPDLALFARQSLVLKLHLLAALGALALGAVLMWARKGARFHRVAGWAWVGLAATTAGASLFITGLNGDHWSLLHLLTGWTFLAVPLALIAVRRRQISRHRRFMSGLFYGGFAINLAIAFIPGRLLWNMALG